MERGGQQIRFKEGDEVRTADDQKLGKVVALVPDMLAPTHLVVEEGLLLKHQHRIPVSAVEHYESGTVYLSVAKDAALAADWDPSVTGTAADSPVDEPW